MKGVLHMKGAMYMKGVLHMKGLFRPKTSVGPTFGTAFWDNGWLYRKANLLW